MIRDVQMRTAAEWWALADGRVWQTRDGGATFVDHTPFETPIVPDQQPSLAVVVDSFLVTPRAVFILRGQSNDEDLRLWSLFVSMNDGASFATHALEARASRGARLQQGPGDALILAESDDGGMNSHAELLLESFDGGNTFRKLGTKTGYGRITFQSPTIWWSVGTCCASESSVFRSSDAGRTWAFSEGDGENGGKLTGISFAESDVMFVDARRGFRFVKNLSNVTELQQTSDGAQTFAATRLPFEMHDGDVFYVVFADPNACIVQHSASLFMTHDQGNTWTRLPDLPSEYRVGAVHRDADVVIWSIDDPAPSTLLRWHDGAKSWERLAPKWSSR